MKKYVIITNGISGYGGGKLYIRNKKAFLENKGWDVLVFSAWNKEVKISELAPYIGFGFEEIVQPVSKYSKKFVQSKLVYMAEIIGDFEECIIESNEIACATWGELLANHLQAKHIIFLLAENVKRESVRFRDFGDYKLKRGEFKACNRTLIKQFFEEGKYSYEQSAKYYLTAPIDFDVFTYEHSKYEDMIEETKLVIGVFSRLDKTFVPTLFFELKKFFKNNLSLKAQIVVIGEGNRFTDKEIKEIFKGLENVEFVFTGHLQPVPAGLLQKTDIVFATAGCAFIARYCKCVTAAIDVSDCGVIGLLGIDTNNLTYRISEPFQEVSSFLQNNLDKLAEFKVLMQQDSTEIGEFEEKFQPHYDWIYQIDKNIGYYDEKQLFRIGGLRTRAIRILNCLMGDRYK